MGDSGHFRRGDAAAAVQGGEDFAEGNHLTTDTGFLFYQSDLVALICEIKGSLHSSNAAAYDKSIDFSDVPCELCGSEQMVTRPDVRPDFGDIVDHEGKKIFDLRYDQALVCVNPDCSYIRPFKKIK